MPKKVPKQRAARGVAAATQAEAANGRRKFQFKSTKNKIPPEQTWLVIETNAFRAQALQTSYLDNFKDASSDKIQVKTHKFSH